ncbi:alkene reductase [Aeromicrobium sp. IC_218]|uniref:alkene reductase n=1 Tax=Aeromicrobium sp. IC_218 TaxID=2545468 RepID=UPI001039F9AD|nr:alkene reductase [Aeromicrobium sp. IC_218]TCI96413.1 alkene reductase [Aeromicrobium sp. IC_218]
MSLNSPTALGSLSLPNRFVMAPMTRSRASADALIQPTAPAYYRQRASAGLIISEGIAISPYGVGGPGIPGLWNQAHVDGWREVTRAVHDAGGRIVAQLWHVGRASHPSLVPGGAQPVGPSAIASSFKIFAAEKRVDHVVPRALDEGGIQELIGQYAASARLAMDAGFDGVEIHGANGYLIDQFLHASANARTDEWGGSPAARARFALEVVRAVIEEVDPDRTGLRLSPSSSFNDMADAERPAVFTELLDQLTPLDLAYVHVLEPGVVGDGALPAEEADVLNSEWFRSRYSGKIISAGGHTRASAEQVLDEGWADAVAFGRLFLANPDLPYRIMTDAPLNEPVRATFYGGGEEGYLDYPSLHDDDRLR